MSHEKAQKAQKAQKEFDSRRMGKPECSGGFIFVLFVPFCGQLLPLCPLWFKTLSLSSRPHHRRAYSPCILPKVWVADHRCSCHSSCIARCDRRTKSVSCRRGIGRCIPDACRRLRML